VSRGAWLGVPLYGAACSNSCCCCCRADRPLAPLPLLPLTPSQPTHPLNTTTTITTPLHSPRIPCVDETTSEILAILDAERIPKACVVGHSYGTLVASRLVKRFPSRLHSLCLVDPVCFGMYMPHLLHNFFYRRLKFDPARPLQVFLDLIVHFASRDLHLAATFSRRFYWSDVIMWPEELPPGSTIVLGAADDLVHADEVRAGVAWGGVQLMHGHLLCMGGVAWGALHGGERKAACRHACMRGHRPTP